MTTNITLIRKDIWDINIWHKYGIKWDINNGIINIGIWDMNNGINAHH